MAEGGGIEPPTPYRVYGLAIRCITALPSLRNLAPGLHRGHRPACTGAGALPSRMWRFGLSMRGHATAGTDMRSDPRFGLPQTFDLQGICRLAACRPPGRPAPDATGIDDPASQPLRFARSCGVLPFRSQGGTGHLIDGRQHVDKIDTFGKGVEKNRIHRHDLGRPFNDLPNPPAYCGGGGICIPRCTAGRLPTASNQRFTFG